MGCRMRCTAEERSASAVMMACTVLALVLVHCVWARICCGGTVGSGERRVAQNRETTGSAVAR